MAEMSVFGINEPKLDLLVLDINSTAERINNKLNLIDKLVYETSSFFDCESGNLFRVRFEKVKESFPTVNRNILNYSADFVQVKEKLHLNEEVISQEFGQATAKVLSNSTERFDSRKN